MTHIMLDLETWGKLPGCDIRSIGAVVFEPETGFIAVPMTPEIPEAAPFYIATDNPVTREFDTKIYTQNEIERLNNMHRRYDLTRDPETVKWWSEQGADAQAAFANPVDLREACERFSRWIVDVTGRNGSINDLRLWANDPHFDECILTMVYRACGLVEPWHYRSPRSMKTICDLANITREDMAQFNYGTMHNALDDAISQAMIVCEGYKRLGLQQTA